MDIVPFMKENFNVENVGVQIGLFIFFLVASIGSINTMMMIVMERSKEIGTMLALGVKRVQLIKLFLIEGSLIGAIGSAIGIITGAAAIYFLNGRGVVVSSAPNITSIIARPVIDYSSLISCFLVGWLGISFASFWPAFRASRLSPIEALNLK